MSMRDDIRKRIFAAENRKPASKLITMFNAEVEVRQPLLQDIMAMGEEASQNSIISLMIQYVYIPETDEKVFEEADTESLITMPFGADFTAFTDAVQALTNIDLKVAEGN